MQHLELFQTCYISLYKNVRLDTFGLLDICVVCVDMCHLCGTWLFGPFIALLLGKLLECLKYPMGSLAEILVAWGHKQHSNLFLVLKIGFEGEF